MRTGRSTQGNERNEEEGIGTAENAKYAKWQEGKSMQLKEKTGGRRTGSNQFSVFSIKFGTGNSTGGNRGSREGFNRKEVNDIREFIKKTAWQATKCGDGVQGDSARRQQEIANRTDAFAER